MSYRQQPNQSQNQNQNRNQNQTLGRHPNRTQNQSLTPNPMPQNIQSSLTFRDFGAQAGVNNPNQLGGFAPSRVLNPGQLPTRQELVLPPAETAQLMGMIRAFVSGDLDGFGNENRSSQTRGGGGNRGGGSENEPPQGRLHRSGRRTGQ